MKKITLTISILFIGVLSFANDKIIEESEAFTANYIVNISHIDLNNNNLNKMILDKIIDTAVQCHEIHHKKTCLLKSHSFEPRVKDISSSDLKTNNLILTISFRVIDRDNELKFIPPYHHFGADNNDNNDNDDNDSMWLKYYIDDFIDDSVMWNDNV